MTKNAKASTASPSFECSAEPCVSCRAGSGAGAAGEAAAGPQICSTQQSSRASQVQEKMPCMPNKQRPQCVCAHCLAVFTVQRKQPF